MLPSELEWEDWRVTRAFFPPGCSSAETRELESSVASRSNEHGPTVLHHAGTPGDRLGPLDVKVFKCFILTGVVPPLSLFCSAILREYGLCLAQLHPNAVQVLAIFQSLCESFVGVMPSVALFHHFFMPRLEAGNSVSGAVTFRFHSGLADHFIELEKKRWDEWRGEWVYMRFPAPDDALAEPSAMMEWRDDWKAPAARVPELQPVLDRIRELRRAGLMGKHVMAHYLLIRLAPLQMRSSPA